MKFFVRQYSFNEFFHGGVGYVDAERILQQEGFIPLTFPYYHSRSLRAKLSRFIYLLKCLSRVKESATIVFLFPVFAILEGLLIRRLSSKKGVRVICFVADIDGIKDGNDQLLNKELADFKRYKYFVVHNEAMRTWLQSRVSPATISCIEFFDFLAEPFHGIREKSRQVAFAGNLAKSAFLEKLGLLKKDSPGLVFNLYGPGFSEQMRLQPNVVYKGVESPNSLPAKIEGSFGLVWDGDSVAEPSGSLGEYMRLISHHKLSLYILSGLPLIVPEIAASALLVKKYGIGITVNTLYEIEEAIDSLPVEEYVQMQENMRPLAQKISNGSCLGQALTALTLI